MSKEKTKKKDKTPEPKIAIGMSQSDVKTFLEKFRSDVAKKKETYQLCRQRFGKKGKQ